MVAAINWTNIIVALIAGLPAIIAAIFAGLVHRQVKTPSGPSIGKQVESAHLTGIANNMLLSRQVPATKKPTNGELEHAVDEGPSIPADGG
jgi:hypothetical protein